MAKNADLGDSLKVIMAAATDTGTVRKQNEDSFYFSEKYQFFILCDGMGGHNAGRLAARTAAETLKDVLRQEKFIDVDRICEDIDERLPNPAMKLIASVRLANRRIFNYAIKYPQYKGMGTTLVAALIDNGWLYIAHVGDSRLYRLRQGELKVLTSDHSYLRELIEDRELSEKEAWQFRQKNVLTRAVGIAPNIKIDLCMDAALPNDLYLLCSDGMYGALPNELILRVLTADHGSLQKTVDRLVNYAKNLDGSDNITAGTILVQDSTPPARHVSLVTKTIAAESGKVSSYLDRFIKKSYPEPVEKKKFKVPLVAGLLLLLAIGIFALVFYFGGSTPETSEAS
ncbi:MAG: serine/threonine-protein phosphatase, partial [Calditrichaeota bacterium]